MQTIERSVDKPRCADRDGTSTTTRRQRLYQIGARFDVDAALHYLAHMLVAGEDPRFIARRLMILASEDIGMAGPSACRCGRRRTERWR